MPSHLITALRAHARGEAIADADTTELLRRWMIAPGSRADGSLVVTSRGERFL